MQHSLTDSIKIHYHSPGMNLEESFTFGSRWNMGSHKMLCNVCFYDRCCHLLAAMCSKPREHAPLHCITYLALTPALMRRIFTRNSRRGRTCARLFRPHKNVLGVEYLTYDFLGWCILSLGLIVRIYRWTFSTPVFVPGNIPNPCDNDGIANTFSTFILFFTRDSIWAAASHVEKIRTIKHPSNHKFEHRFLAEYLVLPS